MENLTYAKLFQSLNSVKFRYVIVGGLAVILHGHTRLTTNTDLIVDLAAPELSQFLANLEQMGFRPRVPVQLADFGRPELREAWQREKGMQVFSIVHPDQPRWVIDLFATSPIEFEALSSRSVKKEIENVAIKVASIDDLITMKRMADRDIDRSDIASLERIKEIEVEYQT